MAISSPEQTDIFQKEAFPAQSRALKEAFPLEKTRGPAPVRTRADARQAALERARTKEARAANRERRRGGRDRHGGGHDRGYIVGEQVGAHLARACVASVLARGEAAARDDRQITLSRKTQRSSLRFKQNGVHGSGTNRRNSGAVSSETTHVQHR
jgi:hypothetical protein